MKRESSFFMQALAAALFVLMAAAQGFAGDADEAMERIQKAYEEIKDLRGAFTQKSVIKDLGRTDTYRGDFYIKPPMKMKWMYKGNTAQDLTINNETVLIYKKGENQAYKGRFDKATYGQTPVALLGGFGSIRDEFTVSGKGDSLILKPKKPMGSVTSIKVNVSGDGFPIRSFVINDSRGNVIEITLHDVRTNTGVKDSVFDVTPPKGVNLMEQ